MKLADLRSTKFFLPPTPHDYVVRPRLESLLELGSDYPVILVSAPAGFGKSTLVSSWLDMSSKRHCWVSLTHSENTFVSFVMHLIGSISKQTMPDFFSGTLGAIKSSETPSQQSIITQFINELSKLNEEFFITLDDFHLIGQPKIHELINELIENPIPKLHLIILTRQDVNLPVDFWRSKARVVEIRQSDLRFNKEEIAALLELNFFRNEFEISSRLMEISEGWATALRVILQDAQTSEDLLIRIDQSNRKETVDIFRYALKQIERELPDRMFMVQIASLFEFFNAEMLVYASSGRNNVVESDKMESFLSELARNHSLIIPLDNDNNWFRFHHLFKEYFNDQLLESYTDEEIKFIHHNGAEWFSTKKLLSEAIEHYILADRQEEAIYIFDHFRWKLLDGNDWVQMGLLLAKFNGYPSIELDLARCWTLIYQARVFEMFGLLPEIEKQISEVQQADRKSKLSAEFNALNPYFLYNSNFHENCIESCEAAITGLESHQTYALGYAYIFLIGSLQATGRYTEAVSRFRSTLQNERLERLRPHLWLVLNYIGWMEADIIELHASSSSLISEAKERADQEALANGYHFKGLGFLASGNYTDAIEYFDRSHKLRYSTIGIIHIMNCIAYVHALLNENLLTKAEGVMHELREYVQMKANDYFSDMLKYVDLEFLYHQNDLQGMRLSIDKIPSIPLINYSNFFIPRISLIRCLLRMKQVDKASVIVNELKERFESTSNGSGLLRIKPFELEISRRNGHHWKEDFVQWIIACRTAKFEGFISYVSEIVLPMARETGVVLPSFVSESNVSYRDLSKRELEISQLLFMSNKEISERLYISDKTVKSHVNSIFRKLGVTSRKEALDALNIPG